MATDLGTIKSRIRKLFRTSPPKPTYEELEVEIARLERERSSLVSIAYQSLCAAEKSNSYHLRSIGTHALVMRWPKAKRLMMGVRLTQMVGAVRQQRDKRRQMLKAFCQKYDKPVPEFRNLEENVND